MTRSHPDATDRHPRASLLPVRNDIPASRPPRIGALAYVMVVLVALLWPSGGDVAGTKDALVLGLLSTNTADVVVNLVMLAPLTFLATIGWPRIPWWAWAVLGCSLSAFAELTQHLLPVLDRRGSWTNVLHNSAGAWAGSACALILLALGGL